MARTAEPTLTAEKLLALRTPENAADYVDDSRVFAAFQP